MKILPQSLLFNPFTLLGLVLGLGSVGGPILICLQNQPVAITATDSTGRIERIDPALDSIVTQNFHIRIIAEGLDWCWRFIPELFEVDAVMEELIARQCVPDPRGFESEYKAAILGVLAEAKLDPPADQRPILGGRRGHHSEHLGHLLAVMQHIPRTYPDAKW